MHAVIFLVCQDREPSKQPSTNNTMLALVIDQTLIHRRRQMRKYAKLWRNTKAHSALVMAKWWRDNAIGYATNHNPVLVYHR